MSLSRFPRLKALGQAIVPSKSTLATSGVELVASIALNYASIANLNKAKHSTSNILNAFDAGNPEEAQKVTIDLVIQNQMVEHSQRVAMDVLLTLPVLVAAARSFANTSVRGSMCTFRYYLDNSVHFIGRALQLGGTAMASYGLIKDGKDDNLTDGMYYNIAGNLASFTGTLFVNYNANWNQNHFKELPLGDEGLALGQSQSAPRL
jgi:hypothetical protein